MAKTNRLILCIKDPDREGEARPLRMRAGRLLVRLVSDPTTADIKAQTRRATLPAEETVILGAAESTENEEIREIKGSGSVWELEIVDGLDGIAGFTNHSARHEDGGADEIDVTDLSGLLADEQDPLDHAADHEDGGGDEIDVTDLSGLLADEQDPLDHASDHEDGGGDEIDVTGLSGKLADGQTPLAHKASHQDGGSDEIEVTGLGGKLADPQPTDLKGEGYAPIYFWLGVEVA